MCSGHNDPENASSHRRCSAKKDVLKNFAKSTGKHSLQKRDSETGIFL